MPGGDHLSICRFKNKESGSFKLVARLVKKWANEVKQWFSNKPWQSEILLSMYFINRVSCKTHHVVLTQLVVFLEEKKIKRTTMSCKSKRLAVSFSSPWFEFGGWRWRWAFSVLSNHSRSSTDLYQNLFVPSHFRRWQTAEKMLIPHLAKRTARTTLD